jgi:GTP:adenosylcobinamide-phosphate guanylyltransferase
MGGKASVERVADVVIIAGGTIRSPDLRAAAEVDVRAVIDLHGKPLLAWVLEALKAAERIGRICVVGNGELLNPIAEPFGAQVIQEGADEVDNLFRGVEALPGAERVFMGASDLPMLTADAVDDFIANAPDVDVVFPICEQSVTLAQYPDREWTFVKTTDGAFTGGCGFLFRPEALLARREWVQEVFDSRRNPWKLMRIWGLVFGIKALLHRVSLAEAEAHISEVLKLTGRAYITQHPELCYDLDYAPHIAQVREHMRQRMESQA